MEDPFLAISPQRPSPSPCKQQGRAGPVSIPHFIPSHARRSLSRVRNRNPVNTSAKRLHEANRNQPDQDQTRPDQTQATAGAPCHVQTLHLRPRGKEKRGEPAKFRCSYGRHAPAEVRKKAE